MQSKLNDLLMKNPIIAAVKDVSCISDVIKSPCEVIFMLTGDSMNLQEIVGLCHDNNKKVFLHLDLIKGFSHDISAIRFIKKYVNPAGVISTKINLLKIAKYEELATIQRIFALDSVSVETAIKSAQSINADAIEVMPGIMPKIIERAYNRINLPVIAGGLIEEKDEIIAALKAGATSISTTRKSLWYM